MSSIESESDHESDNESENDSESDSENSEENLDDFIINASKILSEENHPDKETIIESLKQHLSSIFNNKSEMENLFKTLNGIIFSTSSKSKKKDSQKISNKQPFKLYPLIFSFNPKSSFFYVDFFLTSLKTCASEENRQEFPYLCGIFAEVITTFFSLSDKNKNLLNKKCILEQNKKEKLYEKFLNFCNNNIKINKKTEQSFGCLLLTEFLKNCPMTKEEKKLDNLFNIISEYLDDRWFECKLDLLNCTISLIFTGEKNFKPYANDCLCKIIDYLTDEEWMKRKLAIYIVYTLLFYCKEEVLLDKDNFMDFLLILKDDPVSDVREVCLQTLNYIKECDPNKVEEEEKDNMQMGKEDENELKNQKDCKTNGEKNKINKVSVKKKKKNKNENMMLKLKKEKEILEKLEKEYNEKKNKYRDAKRGMRGKSPEKSEEKLETPEKIDKSEEIKKAQQEKELNDKINSSLYEILQQLKKIHQDQNELYNIYDGVKKTVETNYNNINDRIKAIERRYPKFLFKNNNDKNSSFDKKNPKKI